MDKRFKRLYCVNASVLSLWVGFSTVSILQRGGYEIGDTRSRLVSLTRTAMPQVPLDVLMCSFKLQEAHSKNL
jgi:hypothetical protein